MDGSVILVFVYGDEILCDSGDTVLYRQAGLFQEFSNLRGCDWAHIPNGNLFASRRVTQFAQLSVYCESASLVCFRNRVLLPASRGHEKRSFAIGGQLYFFALVLHSRFDEAL